MAENEKPKPDFLMRWLVFLTYTSVPIWIFFTLIFWECLYFPPSDIISILILLPPITLFITWYQRRKARRGITILFSIIQALLTVLILIVGFAAIMVLGGGTGVC